jgi:hypothetical protein
MTDSLYFYMDFQTRDVGVKILVMCYNPEKKICFCPEIMFAKTLEFHYIVGIKFCFRNVKTSSPTVKQDHLLSLRGILRKVLYILKLL